MLDVEKGRKGDKWQQLEEPASEQNHEDRWSQETHNHESSVLENVGSDIVGDAVTGFEGSLEFGIECSGDGLIFKEEVCLEEEADGDEDFS